MIKRIFTVFTILISSLILTTVAFAANLSVRIESPKTPTNQNNFKINFVTMDILGRGIDVKCFKKGPGDSSFSQFGTTFHLSAGGNTQNCEVTSSIFSSEGSYEFYVTSEAEADTVSSQTVKVEYKTSSPGTPGNYKKEFQGNCQYKISFKTADDGGKTSRIEVYRSEQTNFTAEESTRVGTVWIDSSTEGNLVDSLPDCNKSYYYVIRAFDGAGNGSSTVGDSIVKIILTSTASTVSQTSPIPTLGGAIPVSTSNVSDTGQILGQAEAVATIGATLGEATDSPTIFTPSSSSNPVTNLKQAISNSFIPWIIVIIIAGGGYFLYRNFKS